MKLSKKLISASFLVAIMCSYQLSAMEPEVKSTYGGNKDVNTLTDKVQALTERVREIRDKSAKINPGQDKNALEELVKEMKDLAEPLEAIKTFVEEAINKDSDFKNRLNDEGMPPRIVEGELELSFRYDLDAISRSLGLGTMEENADINKLDWIENDIYNVLEDLKGPLMTFKNLDKRYNEYKRFISEENEVKKESLLRKKEKVQTKARYSAQEAHVVLHIAAYVTAVDQAFELAKDDEGRHLCNLLKVYVNWLQTFATHTHYDVDIVKAHGSLLGISDKNGKTMLDWTNELSKRLNKSNLSDLYAQEAKSQFNEIKRSLRVGLFENPETRTIEKVKTRDPLESESEKLNAWGFKPVKKPLTEKEKADKALDLATESDLSSVRDQSTYTFQRPEKGEYDWRKIDLETERKLGIMKHRLKQKNELKEENLKKQATNQSEKGL